MKDLENKRRKEKEVVKQMITLYCHDNHRTRGNQLCKECQDLIRYAHERSDRCPFMENKTFCSNCKVHCYKPDKRDMIRTVMRYSGPRMIFHHPVMAIRHVVLSKREKRKLERSI